MASLSTHVLDTSAGRPAVGLRITLESADGSVLAEGLTDEDGRIAPLAGDLAAEDHSSGSTRARGSPPRA